MAELEKSLSLLQQEKENNSDENNNNNNKDESGVSDQQTLQLVLQDLRQELKQREDQIRSDRLKHESLARDLTLQLQREKDINNKLKLEVEGLPSKDQIRGILILFVLVV